MAGLTAKMPKNKKTIITPSQRDDILEHLDALREYVASMPIMQACTSCDRFDNQTAWCEEYRAKVPAEHWRVGCDKWADPIPF